MTDPMDRFAVFEHEVTIAYPDRDPPEVAVLKDLARYLGVLDWKVLYEPEAAAVTTE